MTPDEIRAVLAPMYKGHTATFKTPDTIIDVHFDGEVFNICSMNYSGSAAGVSNTKSLKDAVTQVAYFFTPKVGETYQHNNGNIYRVIAIANEHSFALSTHLLWFIKERMNLYGANH